MGEQSKDKGQKDDSKDIHKIEKVDPDKEMIKAEVKSEKTDIKKETEDTDKVKTEPKIEDFKFKTETEGEKRMTSKGKTLQVRKQILRVKKKPQIWKKLRVLLVRVLNWKYVKKNWMK